MNFIEALYEVSKRTGTPVTQIGLRIGTGREYVSRMKRNNTDPGTANAARLLDACGWAIAVMPKDEVPDCALVITPAETTDEEKAEALRRQADQLRKQADKLMEKAEGRE